MKKRLFAFLMVCILLACDVISMSDLIIVQAPDSSVVPDPSYLEENGYFHIDEEFPEEYENFESNLTDPTGNDHAVEKENNYMLERATEHSCETAAAIDSVNRNRENVSVGGGQAAFNQRIDYSADGETGTQIVGISNGGPTPLSETDIRDSIRYFPVTMFDYEPDVINAATHQLEVDAALTSEEGISSLKKWNGLYFGMSGSTSSYEYGTGEYENLQWVNVPYEDIESGKEYILVSYNGQALSAYIDRAADYAITGSPTGYRFGSKVAATDVNNGAMTAATKWKFTKIGDSYSISCVVDGVTYYMSVEENTSSLLVTEVYSKVISTNSGDNGISIGNEDETQWLNRYGGQNSSKYKGWSDDGRGDTGSRLYVYELVQSEITATTASLDYANYNDWHVNNLYSGLAEEKLDINKFIVLKYPNAGIFDSTDSTSKAVYTNVELPFWYEAGTYTFDSSQYGVYFCEDAIQGSTGAQSNGRMYFDYHNTQNWQGMSYSDGSTTIWAPFNNTNTQAGGTGLTGEGDVNHYFGMSATIPFTMTSNGRVNDQIDTSEPIQFSFSGDDDVWVFIDGQLVVDLGGIHNRLDATIDFAANTVVLSENNTNTNPMGDSGTGLFPGTWGNTSNSTGTYTISLFNEVRENEDGTQEKVTGILGRDIETFSASTYHELTIYYLERGGGTANSRIQFNLPMKDTISVTKRANRSVRFGDSDGEIDTTKVTIEELTDSEQSAINNMDFRLRLFKDGNPVANANYYLIDADGQVISEPSTSTEGYFVLRNGQTARFINEIPEDGVTYYVVEDSLYGKGFAYTTYTYSGNANSFYVDGTNYSNLAAYGETSYIYLKKLFEEDTSKVPTLTSASITAYGTLEVDDTLTIVCENFMDASLPNPAARPREDKVVVDYGLPVEIDVLINDLHRGDTVEITEVTGAKFGDVSIITDDHGYDKLYYQLTKPLTGVELLTYTIKVTGTSTNIGGTTTVLSEEASANVYIIPATTMYYEENFSSLVQYVNGSSSGWQNLGTASNSTQEQGIVGITGNSPYGSDAAYKDDSRDSNDTCMYVDTSTGAAGFRYCFTGTGTSFFARTNDWTGYLRIQISQLTQNSEGKEENTVIDTYYLDTRYIGTTTEPAQTDVGTLYNIPVFTYNAEAYGTYIVTVTIAKPAMSEDGKWLLGNLFYLDGIRVQNPLNENDANSALALSAYAEDKEINNTIATLRDKLLKKDENGEYVWSGNSCVVFTDSNGRITSAEEYERNGPKEEVYMNNGQAIHFSLENWDADSYHVYLGIKAPLGSGTVMINGNEVAINNTVDCYYYITPYIKISTVNGKPVAEFIIQAKNVESGFNLVSVTNIKVTGNTKFAILQ